MQFNASILTLLMASLTAAQPVSQNPSALSLEKRGQEDMCGDSTFENKSSGGSPKVDDCRQIARNIAGGGKWTVGAGGEHHQLVQYGTCAFGAQGAGSNMNSAFIGNTDIIDLINDSIKRFEWNGLVGASGVMGCRAMTGYVGG
ncbi:hypothetical protein ACLX1H_006490 [Fusarium chlamydosporum]